MSQVVNVRLVQQSDFQAWKRLWDGYNAFYGRKDGTALRTEITQATWRRFFAPDEPVFALVAETDGKLLGLTHYLFHRSTTRVELVCYLQDLFTAQNDRGRGIARALIQEVYKQAKSAGISRVYWQTHESNAAGRFLYDKLAEHTGFIVYGHEL